MALDIKGSKPITIDVDENLLVDDIFTSSGVVDNSADKIAELERKLYTDAVLGCNNRAKYEETIKTYSGVATLFSIDGNNLKFINDNFSHEAGDFLLGTIAKAGMKVWGDNFYRSGGDEFLVFILNVAQDDATCSSQVSQFKAELLELNKEKPELPVSASVGYAFTSSGVVLSSLLEEADLMMYEDKRVYKESHPEYDMRRAKVTIDTVKQAIEDGTFHEYMEARRKEKGIQSGVADNPVEVDIGDDNLLVQEDTPKKVDDWFPPQEIFENTNNLGVGNAEEDYRKEEFNKKVQPILHETTKKAVTEAVKAQNDKLKLEVSEVLQDEVSYRLSRYEKRRRMRDLKEKIGFITKGVVLLLVVLFIFGNAQLRTRFALVAEDIGNMLSDILQGKETSSNKLVEDLFKNLGDDINNLNTIETTEDSGFDINNEE